MKNQPGTISVKAAIECIGNERLDGKPKPASLPKESVTIRNLPCLTTVSASAKNAKSSRNHQQKAGAESADAEKPTPHQIIFSARSHSTNRFKPSAIGTFGS